MTKRTRSPSPSDNKPKKRRNDRRCTHCNCNISSRKGYIHGPGVVYCTKCHMNHETPSEPIQKEESVIIESSLDILSESVFIETSENLLSEPDLILEQEPNDFDWDSNPVPPSIESDMEKSWKKIEFNTKREIQLLIEMNSFLTSSEEDFVVCDESREYSEDDLLILCGF